MNAQNRRQFLQGVASAAVPLPILATVATPAAEPLPPDPRPGRGRNHPTQERLVLALREAIAAARAMAPLYEAHEPHCQPERYHTCSFCDFCLDADGMLFTLEMFEGMLDAELLPFGKEREEVLSRP